MNRLRDLAVMTICKGVSLSIERGNCDASCVLYANVGRISGPRFGNYQAGFQFGQLAYELVERFGFRRFEASIYLCFAILVVRWLKPIWDCRDLLRRAFDAANRTGDLAYGAYSRNCLVTDLLFAGDPLPEVQAEAEHGLGYARTVQFGLVIDFITAQLALIRILRSLTATFGSLTMSSSMSSRRNTVCPETRRWRRLRVGTGSASCRRATWPVTTKRPLLRRRRRSIYFGPHPVFLRKLSITSMAH